jgi:hypothetical protein
MPVAAKQGSDWIAVTALSIPQRSRDPKGEPRANIVHRGELVTLTDEVAATFLPPHKPVPCIRKASQGTDPGPRITARQLFGHRPGASQFGAREDPPEASKVTVNEDIPDPADPRNAPEANDPQVDLSIDPDAAKDR